VTTRQPAGRGRRVGVAPLFLNLCARLVVVGAVSTKIFVRPQCGTDFVGKGEKTKPTDGMRCPIHGVVGTIEELASRVGRKASDAADQALKTAGIKSTEGK